jgi:NAD(P)-dependent dehydrogenase (short-subunit alcohol dehydrogenase family)
VNLELADRVAIVTGGSSGIGYAIAKVLALEGVQVVVAARRANILHAAAESLSRETGGTVRAIVADTTNDGQVGTLVAEASAMFDRVDILVNCAANPVPNARSLGDVVGEGLLQDLNTKVVGYARCCRAVAPVMKRQKWGRIVNIGGLTGRASYSLGGIRNVAICHLTKTLSDELGPDGITVNAVHPGITRTPHLEELFANEAKQRNCTVAEVESGYVAETPARRIVAAEDIGHMIAFLASTRAAMLTGESIAVDGGYGRGIYL